MKTYEKYKDSGIEWIGEIPEHWKIVPIKRLVGEENTLFLDGDWIESKNIVFDSDGIRYITTGNIGEGIYKEQGLGYITQETFDDLKCTEVFPYDLVISRLNPPIGRCCLIPDLGRKIVTSVDNVILRPNKIFNKNFLKYVLSNEKYFEYTSLIARGATMQRISRSLLGEIKIPISLDDKEQTSIATYLDRKTLEIDRIIANKQKLIALYEEEKQAIINQAVTKGLDPTVQLKDSGVEWLGQIPEHWKVTKINRYIKVKDGTHETPTYLPASDENFPLITSKDFNNGDIDFEDAKYISKDDHFNIIKRSNTEKGDILMSMIGGNIGNLVLVNTDRLFSIKNVCLFKTSQSAYIAKFLYYILKSPLLKIQIDLNSRGGAQGFLSLDDLRNLIYIVLPQNEMIEIVDFIEKECTRLDTIIDKFNKQIELLQEYRTTLISEVVTGKVKVTD